MGDVRALFCDGNLFPVSLMHLLVNKCGQVFHVKDEQISGSPCLALREGLKSFVRLPLRRIPISEVVMQDMIILMMLIGNSYGI